METVRLYVLIKSSGIIDLLVIFLSAFLFALGLIFPSVPACLNTEGAG